LHRWIALVKALLLSRKKFTWIFPFQRNLQKTKKPIFLAPTAKMGSMAGTFTIPEFNSSYTITDSNLVRIGDKKFLEKKPRTPPFYLIFTSENHLNAHSSLIKLHMAMNFAPLDCSCQGASSEPKKIYLDFSVSEKLAKNQKSIFLAPTAKNGFNGRNFYYT
jgi:hypothetical protein